MKILLLALALLAPIPQSKNWIPATEMVYGVSEVSRTLFTGRGKLHFVFSTIYQEDNEQIPAYLFWRRIEIGDTVQLKLELIRGIWKVNRVNLVKP